MSFNTFQLNLITRKSLIKSIFLVTALLAIVCFIMLSFSFFVIGNIYVAPRLFICSCALLCIGLIGHIININKLTLATWLIIGLYTSIAMIALIAWGINMQAGLLTIGLVIFLSSMLLSSKYILPYTASIITLLFLIQFSTELSLITPDHESLSNSPTFADVIGYSIIFVIFAFITHLVRKQSDQSLARALKAEAELQQEKRSLARKLEAQTNHLREAQYKEMHQLYRFAELGQHSTAVLHQLANYLTILTLDIDDISERHEQSNAIANAKESIGHLDAMVEQVRNRLQDNNERKFIDSIDVIQETLKVLKSKIIDSNVEIVVTAESYQNPKRIMGDPLVLGQVMSIIVNNAIDASSSPIGSEKKTIHIIIESKRRHDHILVIDTGIGIPKRQRKNVFEPFKSTKPNGMGIGLYIARKMIESHFRGSIVLDPSLKKTCFIIEIPIYNKVDLL